MRFRILRNDSDKNIPLFQVQLTLERRYGSEGYIQARYDTHSGTDATGGADYTAVDSGAVNFNPGQITATVFIQVQSDTLAEVEEYFFVNLTSISRLPTDMEQGERQQRSITVMS